ncbi:heparan sulfate glucosamine 3-O-sulfotransferase 2 [Aplysia californica]|uniref:Heparan sulfate glucosamine 3-O-sulfotransferase 2 n=1 Tax=Aplysia californica TaxID=6500 RepID=A0ABM0JLN3_APLCA|nr:heparan sulfate glucosamine 3-O-sulfotransferase 2 [Aplysia californica]
MSRSFRRGTRISRFRRYICGHGLTVIMGFTMFMLFLCSGTLVHLSPALPSGHALDAADIPAYLGVQERGDASGSRYPGDNSGDRSYGSQRHNRALQFMDAGRFGRNTKGETGDFLGVVDKRSSTGGSADAGQPKLSPLISNFNAGEQNVPSINTRTFISDSKSDVVKMKTDFKANSDIEKSIRTSQNVAMNSSKYNNLNSDFPLVLRGAEPLHNASEVPVKRLPQALVIGAKKAGTRALLEYLRLHPGVVAAGPEPHFFDRNYHLGLDWYRELMPRSYSDQLTLEKTPAYFITPEVPRLLHQMNPEIKLLLVVRDPVTRAISDYVQASTKRPLDSFEHMALLDPRLGLINTSWAAIKIGIYAKHMERWLQVFPMRQIHLVDGHKLVSDPAKEMAKVEKFLGLPPFIRDEHFFLRGFKGTFPCIMRHGVPHCLDEKTKGRDHPDVDSKVLQRLRDFYRPFNAKFYQMVGHDFGWL